MNRKQKNNLIMKSNFKHLAFILIGISFAFLTSCSTSDDNGPDNPIYLDTNGVTIKAKDWALIGDSGVVNGIGYTIVNAQTLKNMIAAGDDVTRVCTSRVTDMSSLGFHIYFNQDISNWDVSKVTNMWGMFKGIGFFNQDISNWDVSNVFIMNEMFYGAEYFNQSLSNWDVSNVRSMNRMFYGAWKFNQNLSNWDVSTVLFMDSMFEYATHFNQDLSNWDVVNIVDCQSFSSDTPQWTLPKPNFTGCTN